MCGIEELHAPKIIVRYLKISRHSRLSKKIKIKTLVCQKKKNCRVEETMIEFKTFYFDTMLNYRLFQNPTLDIFPSLKPNRGPAFACTQIYRCWQCFSSKPKWERERERVKQGQVHIGKHHQWAVVVWDLVVASYSHEDSGIDKGLMEERNILNFWIWWEA